MKTDPDDNAVNPTQLPMEIFWLEQFRIASQSAQLSCNYRALLSKYALWGSRELMPQQLLHKDE